MNNVRGALAKQLAHPFKVKYKPSSVIAQELFDDLIYNERGIVVVNKPYGISFGQGNDRESKVTEDVTFKTIKPFLLDLLRCKDLVNVKVPEKYTSGVAVLCSDPAMVPNFRKSVLSMRMGGFPYETYEAVCIGGPTSKRSSGYVRGLALQSQGKLKKSVLLSTWSRNAILRGDVQQVVFAHQVLSETEDSSRIEVSSTRNRWHAVRTFLATELLCPVLGDNLFGSRVKAILGSNILMEPFNPVTMARQKVPAEIKKKLDVVSRNDVSIPLHFHQSRVVFKNFIKKGQHLEYSAPPPESFSFTCTQLGLT